jgi:hypothetical protein
VTPSKLIDTKISQALFNLPIPGAAASGSNVLAFRNMARGKFYGLPSGQAVADAMREPILPANPNQGPGFERATPLWYYIRSSPRSVRRANALGRSARASSPRSFSPTSGAIPAPTSTPTRGSSRSVPHEGAFPWATSCASRASPEGVRGDDVQSGPGRQWPPLRNENRHGYLQAEPVDEQHANRLLRAPDGRRRKRSVSTNLRCI